MDPAPVTVVLEFLEALVNTVLYSRGVYPPDIFEQQLRYRTSVFVARHPALRRYIAEALVGLEDEFRAPGKYRFLILIEPENGIPDSSENYSTTSDEKDTHSLNSAASTPRTEMQFTCERYIVDIDYRLNDTQKLEVRELLKRRFQNLNNQTSDRGLDHVDTSPADDITLCAALELTGSRDPAEHTRPYRIETGGPSRAAMASKRLNGIPPADLAVLERGFGRMLVRALTLDSQLLPAHGGSPPTSADSTGLVFYLLLLSDQTPPPAESVREGTKPVERRWVDVASANVLVQGDLGFPVQDQLLRSGGTVLDEDDSTHKSGATQPSLPAHLVESLRIIPLADVRTETLSISLSVEENLAVKSRLAQIRASHSTKE